MKKIILTLSLIIIALSSCSDYIEEDNRSSATTDEYLKASGFEGLVNVNYSQLREIYGNEPWLFVAGTDLYSEGRGLEPPGVSQYAILTPSSTNVDFLYRECYEAIVKANTAVHFGNLTEKTSTLASRILEVRYLRANAYFLLVQTYGGVPLELDYNETPKTSFTRNTAEEIYSFIIKELEEITPSLSTAAYSGRVNMRAAQDLLAKVYLTRGYESFREASDFAKAASYADAAINGQALTIPYADLWAPGFATATKGDTNNEVIFSAKFSAASVSTNPQTLGNSQGSYFGSYLGGPEVSGKSPQRIYSLCVTDHAISLFEQGDKRWDASFMTEIFTNYYDFYSTTADKSPSKVKRFYAPKWFTPADEATYLASHPQLKIDPVDPKRATSTYRRYGTYSSQNTETSDFNMICVRKFDDPTAPYATTGSSRVSTRDFIISRLSDTYLIAAEAYFQLGSPLALQRLNAVRARAGATNATAGQLSIDYILDERAREMIGEYNRWFDLKRTGKLIERASLYNPKVLEANFDGNNGEKKILRPIPQEAIDLNKNKDFPQNPAY